MRLALYILRLQAPHEPSCLVILGVMVVQAASESTLKPSRLGGAEHAWPLAARIVKRVVHIKEMQEAFVKGGEVREECSLVAQR